MKSAGFILFGIAVGCGLTPQFQAAAAGHKEKVFYSFGGGTDGAIPAAGVIDVKGTLYGVTFQGGTNNCGTVFSLDAKTGVETVLHAFGSGSDGVTPYANLIAVKGTLYGTTFEGGSGNGCNYPSCGTVFALDPASRAETVLYSFCSQQNCADGTWPLANLIEVNGTMYGTTFGYGSGTVFALAPKTGAETVLYTFCSQQNCTDGLYPYAGLLDVNDKLYGTTELGGSVTGCNQSPGCGTVFSLDPSTGMEKVLHSFCTQQNCADGAYPSDDLIAVKGKLYGTTSAGGANCQSSGGCGTVFALKRL